MQSPASLQRWRNSPRDKMALYSYNNLAILAYRTSQCFHYTSNPKATFRCTSNCAISFALWYIPANSGPVTASLRAANSPRSSASTVANAYAELESEGLIQGHVGRGTFICGSPVKQFTPAPRTNGNGHGGTRWEALFADERGDEGLSRLMPNVPEDAIAFVNARPSEEFFPVEEFRRCCNSVLKNEGRRVLQLGSTDGYEPLKRVLIEMFRGEGMSVRPEQLLITDGCQQALDLLCKAFLRPGDSVVLENPAYPGAIAIFASARIRTLAVGVETDPARTGYVGIDIDALESVLMQNRVKFILVTPDFHNPT